MNIREFKSVIERFDGPARTNLFYVEIFGANSQYIKNWELRAFCKTATFPGINFQTFEYRPNNMGIGSQMPVAMATEPVNCIFMLDSKHAILSFFHSWMQKIINFSTSNGSFAAINNQLPYEIGYQKEYCATMRITFFSSDNVASNYSVTLEDVYPTNIGSLMLSWEDNDSVAHLPVNFSYSKIRYDTESLGKNQPEFFRELNFDDLLNSLGGINDDISNGANSVQDIINKYYRIKTDYDHLIDKLF